MVLFIAMVLSGNVWDGVADGRIYPVGKIVVNIIILGILWCGFLATGLGSSTGLGVIVGYYVFIGGSLVLWPGVAEQSPAEFNRSYGLGILTMAALSLVVAVVYHRLRKRRIPDVDVGGDLEAP